MPLDTTQEKHVRAAPAQPAAPPSEKEPKRGWLSALPAIPRKLRPWLIVGILAVLALGAWTMFGSGSKKPEIVTAAVTRGDIEQTVLATGMLEPAKLVSVGAQASGQVKKLYVELGDTVKAGRSDRRDRLAHAGTTPSAMRRPALANAERAQRSAAAANLERGAARLRRPETPLPGGARRQGRFRGGQAAVASARARPRRASMRRSSRRSLTLNTAETNLGYTTDHRSDGRDDRRNRHRGRPDGERQPVGADHRQAGQRSTA